MSPQDGPVPQAPTEAPTGDPPMNAPFLSSSEPDRLDTTPEGGFSEQDNFLMEYIGLDSDISGCKGAIQSQPQPDSAPAAGELTGPYQDSASDSSSSSRSGSWSSQSTMDGVEDIVMADASSFNGTTDWSTPWGQYPDFISPAEIDASPVLENFDIGPRSTGGTAMFTGAARTPDMIAADPIMLTSFSPEAGPSNVHYASQASPSAPSSAHQFPQEHRSQYSLDKSMNQSLHANGSQAVSPPQSRIYRRGPSPSSRLNHAVSPKNNAGVPNSFLRNVPNGNPFSTAAWNTHAGSLFPSSSTTGPFGLPNNSAALAMPTQFPVQSVPPPMQVTPQPKLTILVRHFKSRVETQIKIKILMDPLPKGIKKLHLPPHTISKPKFMCTPPPDPAADTLELYTMLVCTSAMQKAELRRRALERAAAGGHPEDRPPPGPREPPPPDDDNPLNGAEVRICSSCIDREVKRANRKKTRRPEEEEPWKRHERKRVIVFNTHEIKDWLKPPKDSHYPPDTRLIDLPIRLACYCRHHAETRGFQVIFTIKDHLGHVVAQSMSPSIMITDDHKAGQERTQPAPAHPNDMDAIQPLPPFRHSNSVPDIQRMKRNAEAASEPPATSMDGAHFTASPTNSSLPASPNDVAGPSSKRRRNGSTVVPSDLQMTSLGMADSPASLSPNQQVAEPCLFASAPNGNGQAMFSSPNSTATMDNFPTRAMYSEPASAHHSRAPSPNGLRSSVIAQNQDFLSSHAVSNGVFPSAASSGLPQPRQASPDIQKVIPDQGPCSGGIDVTILGSGFPPDLDGLDVFFGEMKAPKTQRWAESTLVCLLPPSPLPGPVEVTLRRPNGQIIHSSAGRATFNYKHNFEDDLVRTALVILHRHITTNSEDVRNIVKSIMSTAADGGAGNFESSNKTHLESKLLFVLDLLDQYVDQYDDRTIEARLNLQTKTGHTMLHLSCALGLHRFTAGLLAHDANPNLPDSGGFTALHFAAMYNHPDLVRRLILSRADPTLRTIHGLRAADVARTLDVVRTIRRASRRGTSHHDRTRSATSLRSLWEPPRPAPAVSTEVSTAEPESGTESLEYRSSYPSSYVSSEEDVEPEDEQRLNVGHGSTHGLGSSAHESSPAPLMKVPDAEGSGGKAPVAEAPGGLRDQFAAFQQIPHSVAAQIVNITHLTTQQMPNVLPPDHSILQLMASLLPHIGRPQLDYTSSSEASKACAAPPPAYEDLFPDGGSRGKLDKSRKRRRSAAGAAAKAKADGKCAALYDQAAETDGSSSSSSSSAAAAAAAAAAEPRQLPKLLQIGRKDNITKEQQENLRRAHAENMKRLGSDRNLFLLWIPMLVFILCAMLYRRSPGVFSPLLNALAPSKICRAVAHTYERIVLAEND